MEEQIVNIISKIVNLNNLCIDKDSIRNTIIITNKIDDEAIILQFSEDGIWVRLRAPRTGYFCESIEEFKAYIKALMTNEIEVYVGTNNNDWIETIFVSSNNNDEIKEGLDYEISYWTYSIKYD